MSGTLRVAICDPNETSRESVKKSLIGMDQVWLEADSSRYELFPDIVEQANPDVAIIDIDDDEGKALSLVEQVAKAHPQCGVIVVSSLADGQLILRAMRAGAREFLNSPIKIEELVGALDRVAAASGGDNRSKSGQIITFAGASGGVGNFYRCQRSCVDGSES